MKQIESGVSGATADAATPEARPALHKTVVLMLPWGVLSLWNSPPSSLSSQMWFAGLAGVLACCSVTGFALRLSLAPKSAGWFERSAWLTQKRRRVANWLSAVLISAVIILAADKAIEFMLFGFIWTGTSLAHAPSMPMLVEAAIQEEILFRLFLLTGILWTVERLGSFSGFIGSGTVFWAANVLQALLFGAAHAAEGDVVIDGLLWPIRIAATPQTLGGLVLGWVYRYYGVGASISSHVLSNALFLLAA